jgi:ATP-binding protein involved in chromosome partitioning
MRERPKRLKREQNNGEGRWPVCCGRIEIDGLSHIKHIVPVASGKGGVGKTTVTVNLALALQRHGAVVGIFDADVYGPNVPLMLGIHQRAQNRESYVPVARRPGSKPTVKPIERFGLKIFSMGLLIGENQAINPPPDTVGQIVVHTMREVDWGELDYLLVDMPPSSGQPQADLVQQVPLSGVVIVTTPQDLSLLDAERSFRLFEQAKVTILGIVENMSYFVCPDCGERHEIFRRAAAEQPAVFAAAPLLGRIPLAPAISQGINQAAPIVYAAPDSAQAQAFLEIGAALEKSLSDQS